MLKEQLQGKDGKPLKGLIIASPSNPTGTIISPPDFKDICEFCSQNGVRMISDEIYHGITIEGENACALSFNPHSIVINSFSKYFSMTGWRLGWVVCQDQDFNKRMEALLQNLFISAPTLSQQAGIAAFDSDDELQAHVLRYKENAKILSRMLPQAGFNDISRPQGAFYLYCNVEELIALWGVKDSMDLCKIILSQCAVACTPGLDFDPARGGKYIRFSYAGSSAHMEEACLRLQDWYKAKTAA
jgi:aspartate/methionine/tyrosine aminotransferase